MHKKDLDWFKRFATHCYITGKLNVLQQQKNILLNTNDMTVDKEWLMGLLSFNIQELTENIQKYFDTAYLRVEKEMEEMINGDTYDSLLDDNTKGGNA